MSGTGMFCELCGVLSNDARSHAEHVAGKRHRNRLVHESTTRKRSHHSQQQYAANSTSSAPAATPISSEVDELYCVFCNIQLADSNSFQRHCSGSAHTAQQGAYERGTFNGQLAATQKVYDSFRDDMLDMVTTDNPVRFLAWLEQTIIQRRKYGSVRTHGTVAAQMAALPRRSLEQVYTRLHPISQSLSWFFASVATSCTHYPFQQLHDIYESEMKQREMQKAAGGMSEEIDNPDHSDNFEDREECDDHEYDEHM